MCAFLVQEIVRQCNKDAHGLVRWMSYSGPIRNVDSSSCMHLPFGQWGFMAASLMSLVRRVQASLAWGGRASS